MAEQSPTGPEENESAWARQLRERPASGPAPTEHDWTNARIRKEIAARQAEEFGQCLKWAISAFGMGWLPSHRHFLLDRDEEHRVRYTDERARPAATVYTVKNAEGHVRHFTINEQGR